MALAKQLWRNLSIHMQVPCYMNNVPCLSLDIHRTNDFNSQRFPQYLHSMLFSSLTVSCMSKNIVEVLSSFT